jgi:hypothetical protein
LGFALSGLNHFERVKLLERDFYVIGGMMANNGFKVLDSDMHILEPADLWQRYTDKRFKHLAPIGTTDHVRDLRLVGPDGRAWGRPPDPPAGTLPPPGHIFHKNQKLFRTHYERGWTAQVQLDAMDEEGIDLAMLYPSRGLNVLSMPDLDRELAAALARAYNDWLYEFCQARPSKLLGAGMISPFNIDDAIAETRRCVETLGFRAIFLRANIVNGHNWHDPYYEPLWSAFEDLGVPLGFHEANNSAARQLATNSVMTSCYAILFLIPSNKCSPSVVSAEAASWTAILDCAWRFSKATAVGCRFSCGASTNIGNCTATNGRRDSRSRRAPTSRDSATHR